MVPKYITYFSLQEAVSYSTADTLRLTSNVVSLIWWETRLDASSILTIYNIIGVELFAKTHHFTQASAPR